MFVFMLVRLLVAIELTLFAVSITLLVKLFMLVFELLPVPEPNSPVPDDDPVPDVEAVLPEVPDEELNIPKALAPPPLLF